MQNKKTKPVHKNPQAGNQGMKKHMDKLFFRMRDKKKKKITEKCSSSFDISQMNDF